jgi:hypothetical protein
MNLENLNRKQKIELIKRIQAGEVNIIAGQIIESGVILIRSGEDYFLNGVKCSIGDFEQCTEAIIILPDNER